MIHNCQRETINLIKLGSLDTSGVEQALYRANEVQQAFPFKADFYEFNLPLDERFLLTNGA
jgi:hypothetical protein